jgi:type I restriction enzyme, S subunit
LRAKRRAALAQLGILGQSIFLDLFGDPATNPKQWTLSSIGDIAEQVTDGEHLTPKRTREGIRLLSARNIRDGYIDFSEVDYIGAEEFERLKRRCNPSIGDVLISCSGTIGRVALVETTAPLSLVRSVALVRPKKSMICSKFLEHYLRTPALKRRMLSRANASSQANLFQNQIRALPVCVPPIELQCAFTRRISGVEQIRITENTSRTKLDNFFDSLQQHAFRGKL